MYSVKHFFGGGKSNGCMTSEWKAKSGYILPRKYVFRTIRQGHHNERMNVI